jgi:hypothetical protein
MNTPYNAGRRAAERGFSLDDNPYHDEKSASEWEDGFYSYQPRQKIRKGVREWA